MSDDRTLDQLSDGEEAMIAEVVGDDGVAIRIMEMGIIDGMSVRCIGRAPLGDPIEFEVRGSRVSLRSAEAARVRLA